MGRVVDCFLRAKHWQIFLMFVVFFVLSPVALFGSGKGFYFFLAITVVFEGLLVAWFWSMGSFLNSTVERRLQLAVGFFRFALVYPLLYVVVFFMFFVNAAPATFLVLLPLHLFAMFCTLYSMYFVSKSLVLAETREAVSFHQYVGTLLLLWLFPVGVWIIQPRVNRLFAENRAMKPLPSN